MINRRALEKIHSYTEIGMDEGAKLLTGGEVASGNGLGDWELLPPDHLRRRRPADARRPGGDLRPLTTVLIRVKDVDDAIRVSNGIEFGLSSSIFTRDVNTAFRAMRDLEAGITYINAGTIGAEVHLPFGGVKGTGNGHREAGQAALDVFTEWKSIYVDDPRASCSAPDDGEERGPLEPETGRLRSPREVLDPLRDGRTRAEDWRARAKSWRPRADAHDRRAGS